MSKRGRIRVEICNAVVEDTIELGRGSVLQPRIQQRLFDTVPQTASSSNTALYQYQRKYTRREAIYALLGPGSSIGRRYGLNTVAFPRHFTAALPWASMLLFNDLFGSLELSRREEASEAPVEVLLVCRSMFSGR
jgi:hypothetical protein